MTRRSQLWLAAAAVFTLSNVVFAGLAAGAGERVHAGVHVVLTLLGAWGTWRLASRLRDQSSPLLPVADDRLEYLQQSVDAVALEVERIGEAQRFSTMLQAEQVKARQRGGGGDGATAAQHDGARTQMPGPPGEANP